MLHYLVIDHNKSKTGVPADKDESTDFGVDRVGLVKRQWCLVWLQNGSDWHQIQDFSDLCEPECTEI